MPSRNPQSRQHHFVPQCYLKGFSRVRQRKAKLHVVDFLASKTFQTSTQKVASQRDFNRVDLEGVPPDAVEQDLAKFEGELEIRLTSIIQHKTLDRNDDFIYLMNFISMLAGRNPRFRQNFGQFENDVFKQVLRLITSTQERWESQLQQMRDAGHEDIGREISYEEVKRFVDEDEFDIELSNTHHIELEIESLEVLLQCLADREWRLYITSKKGAHFVTCDHPVSLIWSDPKDRSKMPPPGFGMSETDVVFPISRQIAAVGRFDGTSDVVEAEERDIALINGLTINNAQRQVYAADNAFAFLHGGKILSGHDLLEVTGR